MKQDSKAIMAHQHYVNYKRTLRIVDVVFGSYNCISTVPFLLKGEWINAGCLLLFFFFNMALSVLAGFRVDFITHSYFKARQVEMIRHLIGAVLAGAIFAMTGWWEGLLILTLGGTIQMGILLQKPEIGRILVVLYAVLFVIICLSNNFYPTSMTITMMGLFLMIGLTFVEITTYLGRSLIQIRENNLVITRKHSELVTLYNELDGVISIIAHDLRSPFTRTKGLAQVLRFAKEKSEESDIIAKIIHAADHGLDIVNDILALKSSDIKTMQLEHIEITELVGHEIMSNFANDLTQKSLQVDFRHNGPLYVTTSRKLILRVLDNLVSNAIKFSPPGKTVSIGIFKNSEVVLMYVKDEGPGFTEEDKKHVFKKFQRLSARPTGSESSTGLGLFIVKELVRELSGTIRFTSEHGKGTIFEITLPIKPKNESA